MTLVNAELYSALQTAGMPAEQAQAFAHTLRETPPQPVLLIPSLSLRDLFAAVALHALIGTKFQAMAVERAYEMADAMLKARAADPGSGR